MKQVLIQQGRVVLADVPAPKTESGSVLVRSHYSCISTGTEMSGIHTSGMPLWRRTLQRPSSLARVWKRVQSDGLLPTWQKIQDFKNRVAVAQPTGYSLSGTVAQTGSGVRDFAVGDRVACAGAQCAFHAEWVCVPQNLVVRVPDRLDLDLASTVTLGAIALQGVRRAHPSLGECFVVIGLGVLGQLAVQLLRINGCRTIGVDLDRDRISLAQRLGLNHGLHPDDGEDVQRVAQLTGGIGADGVVIAAATPSDDVVSAAFQMCRKKGRVVLIGDVGLKLNRSDFYEKELDLFISTSYGPGRYDRKYEDEGLDYPVAYVRWTENRNMAEYLHLLEEGRVPIRELIGGTFPIGQAPQAYGTLQSTPRPLVVLLHYPESENKSVKLDMISVNRPGRVRGPRLRLALVGPGSFAQQVHLPNIEELRDRIELRTIVSRTGHTAVSLAHRYGARSVTTDYEEVLRDPEIDAVLIATRHNSHTSLALAALDAGKHVFLEKPLALTWQDLHRIQNFYGEKQNTDRPLLLTGFNRRFSPFASRIPRTFNVV